MDTSYLSMFSFRGKGRVLYALFLKTNKQSLISLWGSLTISQGVH